VAELVEWVVAQQTAQDRTDKAFHELRQHGLLS
jgi:hypothetical protein